MNPWVRGIVVALCVVAIVYLAYQFGAGLDDDPAMQVTPSQSGPQE